MKIASKKSPPKVSKFIILMGFFAHRSAFPGYQFLWIYERLPPQSVVANKKVPPEDPSAEVAGFAFSLRRSLWSVAVDFVEVAYLHPITE